MIKILYCESQKQNIFKKFNIFSYLEASLYSKKVVEKKFKLLRLFLTNNNSISKNLFFQTIKIIDYLHLI